MDDTPRKSIKTVVSHHHHLSNDLVFLILRWLPVKSLLRFKTVCKEWQTLIQDEDFIIANSIWSPIVPIESRPTQLRTANEQKYVRKKYFRGIVLEKSVSSGKYRVRNPALGQVLDLPNPNKPSLFMNFAYHCQQYKLVSLYYDGKARGCEVLSFGSDDLSWVTVTSPQPSFWRQEVEVFTFMCIDGVVHYFWQDTVKIGVESFGVKTGLFYSCSLVEGFFTGCCHRDDVNAVNWGGKPAVYAIKNDGHIHVLVLEDHTKHEWGKRIMTYPLTFLEEDSLMRYDDLVLEHVVGDELCFRWKGNVEIRYNKESKKTAGLKLIGNGGPGRRQIYGRQSMVTFKGMRPVGDDTVTDDVDPTRPRKHDRIEVTSGARSGATGKLIGVYGSDGIVKFDDNLVVEIVDMNILAKLTQSTSTA